MEIERFFKPDDDAFYVNAKKERKLRGVNFDPQKVRINKADEQTKLPPVPVETVFSYVNEFLEELMAENRCKKQNIRRECIVLDNVTQEILNNRIIAKNCSLDNPTAAQKYRAIQAKFQLRKPNDII